MSILSSFMPVKMYYCAEFMNRELLLKQRLICVTVIDRSDDAVPLAEALLAGGLNVIEVTFRTSGAADAIARIRKNVPQIFVGAGTLLSVEQVKQAIGSGAQFGVSPGLSESVLKLASECDFPFFPGIMTPTEIARAIELGYKRLKYFPAEAAGGVQMLKALAGPFAHIGIQFIPTGGITAVTLPSYLALPQVAAIGGSWMAERKLVAERAWRKITLQTAEAMKIVAQVQKSA
jgi:2-dehydro-3-deoxyphosphogluconate aldolase/(4S)-4-hydroxy-2-oxoglutarate aldolase